MDSYVIITIFDESGKYELSAEVAPNYTFDNIKLRSVEQEELWDNDVWLLAHLMPAARDACEMREGYERAALELTSEWKIPEEDFCTVHELFQTAKLYGLIPTPPANYEFGQN